MTSLSHTEQERWREQWTHFDMAPERERPLLEKWLAPLTLQQVQGLDVLDAGCGNGAHTFLLAQAGANTVTAIDYASWQEAAQRLAHLPNVTVSFHDLDAGPPAGSYDLVVCIGVLPHVRDPESAIGHLAKTLRPGGRLLMWATVREGNAGLLFFDSVKRLLTSWSGRTAKTFVAGVMAYASRPAQWCAAHSRTMRRVLPYGEYLAGLAALPIARVEQNFYDALNAPRRILFHSEQVVNWMRAAGLETNAYVSGDAKSRTWIGTRVL